MIVSKERRFDQLTTDNCINNVYRVLVKAAKHKHFKVKERYKKNTEQNKMKNT